MNILFPRLNNGYIPLLLCFIAFLAGISGSLQAPFYPKEAKAKGLNKIHVGLVFGAYHFIIFMTSPFFGKKVKNIGTKKMIYIGVIIMGSAGICFGLLEFIQNKTLFIFLSYAIRGIEAVGHSSFKTATFTIVANEYPDTVGSLFSFLQASFGAGLTLGPFFGGVLYNMGGFCLPFIFIGSMKVIVSLIVYLILPSYKCESPSDQNNVSNPHGLRDLFYVPEIPLQVISTLGATICIGFLQATLRYHIDQFHLSETSYGKSQIETY